MYIGIFILELALLYFLSKSLKSKLIYLLLRITRNKHITFSLFSLIYYPGVVIHELSHLIIATILFVPVKDIHLMPKLTENNTIQGGSVVTRDSDIFRKTLIGIAPIVMGLFLLWSITFMIMIPLLQPYLPIQNDQLPITNFPDASSRDPDLQQVLSERRDPISQFRNFAVSLSLVSSHLHLLNILFLIFNLYMVFTISSTMFSSRKDLTALLYTTPMLLFAILFLWILNSWLSLNLQPLLWFQSMFFMLSITLILPIILIVIGLTAVFCISHYPV